ncbi:Ig-like domain-containing protein, partial [Sulfurimonas sp.]
MLHIIKKITLTLLLSLTLQAQSGLNQTHLVSLSPEPSSKDVSADTSIEVKYDLSISKHSLYEEAIVLKNAKHEKIEGTLSIKNNTTLIFTPNKELASGEYKVKVKHINLQDYRLNTRFKRYAKRVCSYFYDDVTQCRLYNYASRVKTKQIKYSFSVDDNKPKIISIMLNKSNIQLNEDNTTTISVNAKYDDNTTVDVTDKVEWILSNPNIIKINKNVITSMAEGTTSLQAKLNTQKTKVILLTVYKEINGYKLPPEPDETLNNSTLLGIDVNNNGVRDDVERWIFLEMKIYNGYEKIEQTIAMQEAKAYQLTLIDPTNKDD